MKTLHDALLICGTQQNLADICGVSQSLISQWISGKKSPSPASVVSILRETGIDLRYLHPDVFILSAPHPEQHEKELPKGTKKRRVNVDLGGQTAGRPEAGKERPETADGSGVRAPCTRKIWP